MLVGNCLSNHIDMDKETKIKEWLLKTVGDESWKEYNDLHIDTIDPFFKNKDNWLNGGLECYNIANKFLKEASLPFLLELAIVLKSKKKQQNYIIKSFENIKKDLTQTPPSLYIYRLDWEGLNNMFKKSVPLTDLTFENIESLPYYSQGFNSEDNEIRRSFFILNKSVSSLR